jgi:hypothetical protein
MNAPEDRSGSKPVKLGLSKCSGLPPESGPSIDALMRTRPQESDDARRHCLLPPPALRERCHRGLARLGVAVRRCASFMVPEGQCPHPRCPDWRCVGFENSANHDAVSKHIEIVVVPLAGWSAGRCAFENEVVLLHRAAPHVVRPLPI